MTLRKWGPRILLAIGVALAAWGCVNALNRGKQSAVSATYSFTHADWALIIAGIVVGAVALAWNAWESRKDA
jgi:hypothetical protein